MKLVTYTPFFQDVDALKRRLENDREYNLTGIYIDGPHLDFPHYSDISTDGSRELIQAYENTIMLEAPPSRKQLKFNMATEAAKNLRAQYMLRLGADEYIEGNLTKFVENVDSNYPMNNVRFKEHQPKTKYNREIAALPRLVTDLNIIQSEVHWIFFKDEEILVKEDFPITEGIVIHHDDSIRPEWRNKQMEVFQDKDRDREQEIITEKYLRLILKKPGKPIISQGGNKYYKCGCIYTIQDMWYNLCNNHKEKQIDI